MASTTCSVATNVIASLGTTPQERGLTTDQFKAKFDQFATEFVAWFNATHIGTDKSHIGDNPAVRVYHSVDQSIANDTNTTVAFNSEQFDTDTMHDASTNNSRLTCKTAGKYLIISNITWETNVTGFRQQQIKLNGATVLSTQRDVAGGTNMQTQSTLYNLSVNDYVELVVYQNAGGPLTLIGTETGAKFMMVRVG